MEVRIALFLPSLVLISYLPMAMEAAKVGQASLLASESGHLSLGGCDLKKFPDGIYLILKHAQIRTIDLSINAISTLSAKFFSTFENITHLNISHNNLAQLPDEASLMVQLQVLNASNNKFALIPDSIMKLPSLTLIDVSSNSIENVTLEYFFFLPSLSEMDISDNPLSLTSKSSLQSATILKFKI